MAIGSRWVPRAPHDGAEVRSAWEFARAVGLEPGDAEIAVRAAFAAAAPSSGAAALLVAAGEVTASLCDLAVEGASRFARAFRSLPWPVQVVLWAGAVDAIPLSTVLRELGAHAVDVWDPSRQLLHAYVLEGARSARPECAAALTRVAAHIEAASLRDPRDLDPHIAGCRSCQYGFPIRVAEELRLLAGPAGPPPARLGRQLAADRERLAAGLPLLVSTPRAPRPRTRALAVAGAVAVIAAAGFSVSQRGGPHAPPGPVQTAAAAPTTSVVPVQKGAPEARAAAVFETSRPTSTTAVVSAGGDLSAVFGPKGAAGVTGPGSRPVATAGQASTPAPSPMAVPSASGAAPPSSPPDILPFPGGQPMAVTPTTGAPFVPPPVPYIPLPIPTTTSPPPTTTTPPPTTAPPTTTPPPSTDPSTTTTMPATTTTDVTTTTTAPTTTTTSAPTTTATTTAAAVMPFVGGPLAVFVPGIGLPLVARRRHRGRRAPSRSR